MHRKTILGWSMIVLLTAILLPGCGANGPAATPTKDAAAVYTQAAEAVNSELTQSAALTPSATPQPAATATAAVLPTLANSATPAAPESTATPAATLTNTVPASTNDEQAELVSQSVPDKSTFAPGQSFKITWTLKNTGKTTWTTMYALRWFGGLAADGLTVANTVNLANEVIPGDSIDVTVSFTAPKNGASARTIWYLQNMMTGANILKLSLDIVIAGAPVTATTTATAAFTSTAATVAATPTPTAAATTAAAATATAATPSVTPTK